MEMYFYVGRGFRNALTVDLGIDGNVDDLLLGVDGVLQKLFVLRCTNVALGWGMQWLEPWKCCEIRENRLLFDEGEFINRYLSKNGRLSQKKEYDASLAEIRARAGAEPHLAIRGHDAYQVLGWFLKKTGLKEELCAEIVLQSLARSACRIDELLQYPLFQSLQMRLTT
jgi:hypothetical protein